MELSQGLSVNGFKCVEETSQFNAGFIKSYTGESDEESFKSMLNILKRNIMTFTIVYHFWPNEGKFTA